MPPLKHSPLILLRSPAIVITILLTLVSSWPAQGSVVISGTRFIYPADQQDVNIWFENTGRTPFLMQVWLDEGDDTVAPSEVQAPFVAAPPIFRMNAGKKQVMRLIYNGASLPTDKESLFWLNALEVPPKAKNAETQSQVQFAFRTRLKVFFRPSSLPYPPEAAPEKLRWQLVGDDTEAALQVNNPTPYHISFESVALVASGKRYGEPLSSTPNASMVKPTASNRFPLRELPSLATEGVKVEFTTINDYGGRINHTATLSP